LAKTPRKWTGARTPSGLKRVRSAERRHEILQPRRTAAKTLTKKALSVATTQPEGADAQVALAEALSALDRAAKSGAIHPNAAARRKSRLTRKVNAALGGVAVPTTARATKTTGTAAAQKAAKARIAASKAAKAKGAQTAAGKARAALSKTARAEAAAAAAKAEAAAPAAAATSKTTATKAATTKAAASKTTKTASKTTAAKTTKTAAPKASAAKTVEKAAPKATARASRAKKTEADSAS
jgi:ribosomal protein S20